MKRNNSERLVERDERRYWKIGWKIDDSKMIDDDYWLLIFFKTHVMVTYL